MYNNKKEIKLLIKLVRKTKLKNLKISFWCIEDFDLSLNYYFKDRFFFFTSKGKDLTTDLQKDTKRWMPFQLCLKNLKKSFFFVRQHLQNTKDYY